MIRAILACDDAGGIGKNNSMPWPRNSQDMKWFKDNTLGHIVVMGSSTWNSNGMLRPLPNRTNIVVTSKPQLITGADRCIGGNIQEEIVKLSNDNSGLYTWIIGGSNLIDQCWEVITKFYLTRIPSDYNCDTFISLDRIYNNFELTYFHTGENDTFFEIWEKI